MSNVTKINVPLLIVSTNSSSITSNGGNIISIQTTGTPTDTSLLNVQVDGQQAQIVSSTNT